MLYNSTQIADEIRQLVQKHEYCKRICIEIGFSCNASFHKFILKNLYFQFMIGNIGCFII